MTESHRGFGVARFTIKGVLMALVVVACGGADQPAAPPDVATTAPAEGAATTARPTTTAGPAAGECDTMDTVTFRLNWVQNYNQLPMTVADAQGFYADECLEVDIQGGQGSGDTVQVVGTGAAPIGIADTVAILQGQANDLPVTGVAVVWRNNAFAVLIRPDAVGSDQPTPEDLYGLTHGAVTTGSPYIFWNAFVNEQGLDASQITEVSISPPGYAELAQGSVDFITNFRAAQFILEDQDVETLLLEAADYGQEGYGLAILANSDWLAEEGSDDILTRFLRASARGMMWSGNHPEEAIEILGEFNPRPQSELRPFTDSITLWSDEGLDDPQSFLTFTEERLRATQQLLYDGGVLEGEPGDVMEHWTTQYLPDPSTFIGE